MAKDLTTTVFEPIQPEGLALALMVTTIVFTVLSTIVVALRFYARISLGLFSIEDWLMLAGWLINLGHNAAVIVLSYSGIGSPDDVITVGMQFHMGLWTIIWQFLYVLDGALIKSSIIWTLLRLAKGLNKNYTRILWVLFGFAWITWQISWPVAIFQCKPVAAAWGEPGDCTSGQTVILNVSYFVSAANIFTDISTSLVPAFLLRHVQIPPRLKLVTIGILSLGVLASVATTIRITYTWAYTTPHNRYFQIGKIVLLTVLECDLGIIAGSMPMLRTLLRVVAPGLAATDGGTPGQSRDINLKTIGSTGRRTHMKLTNAGESKNYDKDYHFQDREGSDDNESSRHIIHVTRKIEQDSVSDRGVMDDHYQVVVTSSDGHGVSYGGDRFH
ncbi:hypothetical protein ACHAPV_006818 [Trichoderma viride]